MTPFINFSDWFRKPHPLLLENRQRFAGMEQGRPLNEYSFVALDTELTGLNRNRDEIISIGAVKIDNLQIRLNSTFHQYIRPKKMEHTKATFVHQITPQQLADAPTIEEVLPEFVEFCGDSLLVGHFLDIDMHFLNRAARKVLGGSLSNPGVDTMRMAKGYKEASQAMGFGHCDQTFSYKLEALTAEFNLPCFKTHDALEDALQCAYLFLYLVKKLTAGKVRTLADLYQAGRLLRLM